MSTTKNRLGRGLGNLIAAGRTPTVVKKTEAAATPKPEAPPAAGPAGYSEITIALVEPSRHQPRRQFAEESLRELAESIRSEGLLQPIVVRAAGAKFQLIAGERRWRACQLLGLKTIPARVVQASDASSAVMTLIENLQREELNPIEEALGYASLLRDFSLTQEAIAERVGKGRATVANALRLLQLEREVQGYLSKGQLSTGHAKALLGMADEAQRLILARRCLEEGWSVRELERQARRLKAGPARAPGRTSAEAESTAIRDVEKRLATKLNTRVSLKHSSKHGRIVIEYFGNEDLQRILDHLGIGT
jgi:ParB family transcriptional regulator, chromosome partitioning protein